MLAAKSGDGKGLRKLPAGDDPECDTTDANYNDCGFVHTNSGIHNKAAFLLINGGMHDGCNMTSASARARPSGSSTTCWSTACGTAPSS